MRGKKKGRGEGECVVEGKDEGINWMGKVAYTKRVKKKWKRKKRNGNERKVK